MVVKLDRDLWRDRLRRVSAEFKAFPDIFDSQVKLNVSHQTRYLVTTEGTELINERLIWAVHYAANGRAPDGLLVPHYKSFYGAAESELPDEKTLLATARLLAQEIRRLRESPMMDPFNGPAILLPEAAGVFFHEALGHRLEGERQNDNKEGATFKGQIGKPILPTFLTRDRRPDHAAAGPGVAQRLLPLRRRGGGCPAGDAGRAGSPAQLPQEPHPGEGLAQLERPRPLRRHAGPHRPHGQHHRPLDPRVPYAKLKEMLLDEVRRQKKAFGLIIADISGGQTNTTTYDFQAFKGMPRIVYRVDAETGKETLVRGVEFVGTPIGSLNRIVAASDTEGVFNGFCGAESGYVPVSTVAPAVLISEIELQRTRRAMERPPILPAPWVKLTMTAAG